MIYNINKNILIEEFFSPKQPTYNFTFPTDIGEIKNNIQTHSENKDAIYNHLTTVKNATLDNVPQELKLNYLSSHSNYTPSIAGIATLSGEKLEPNTIEALQHNDVLKKHLSDIQSNYKIDPTYYDTHHSNMFKHAFINDYKNDSDPQAFNYVPWTNYQIDHNRPQNISKN